MIRSKVKYLSNPSLNGHSRDPNDPLPLTAYLVLASDRMKRSLPLCWADNLQWHDLELFLRVAT